jgi:hypothetical protein
MSDCLLTVDRRRHCMVPCIEEEEGAHYTLEVDINTAAISMTHESGLYHQYQTDTFIESRMTLVVM